MDKTQEEYIQLQDSIEALKRDSLWNKWHCQLANVLYRVVKSRSMADVSEGAPACGLTSARMFATLFMAECRTPEGVLLGPHC